MMLTDKDYILKGNRAYVSYIRSYTEHQVASILKVSDLDFRSIAESFFLFKLPFIKEIKGEGIDTNLATEEELAALESIEFKNKNQAQMIQKKIKEDKGKSKFSIEAHFGSYSRRTDVGEKEEDEEDC